MSSGLGSHLYSLTGRLERRIVTRAGLAVLLSGLAATACGAPAPAADEGETSRKAHVPEGFWDHWSDGQAEINGYRLVQPRYGQERVGEAVLVFVTETFTEASRVKSDGGHPDEYPVLKLNDMRDFQTGVYDYHAMTSSFLGLGGGQLFGQPVKTSFSMQEWCGHQYAQWLTVDGSIHETLHSYWDGEADRQLVLEIPEGAVFADGLPMTLRGVNGALLAAGEKRSFPYLERMLDFRLRREAPKWTTATISRTQVPQERSTEIGPIVADTYRVELDGGAWQEFWVEQQAPHRLLRWTTSTGERAELLGSMRSQYWNQSALGDEGLRARLGLSVLAKSSDEPIDLPASAGPD